VLARSLRSGLTVVCVGVLALGFPSCSKSDATGSGDDGGDEADVLNLDDQTLGDDSGSCNPCLAVCPCTLNDMFFNPATCENIVCGPSGFWGGTSCIGMNGGCPEAGDDEDADNGDDGPAGPTPDASLDGTTGEAGESGADAGPDATSDAPGEAATAPEGGADAGPG